MFRRGVILGLAILLAACNLSVPQATPTVAPTRTVSPTPPATDTAIPTAIVLVVSATPTPSITPTLTLTNTVTATASLTTTPSSTPTFTPSATNQPTATPTDTLTPTFTPTSTLTLSPMPSATFTLTPTPTQTPTFTPSATNQPTATSTFTATNTPTATATFTPTTTDQPTATPTLTPLPTNTPRPTATDTPIPSPTPLPLIPTATPTATATLTASPTITLTPSNTVPPSLTPLPTLTDTPTWTQPPTFTAAPTGTPTRNLSPEEIARLTPTVPVITTIPPTLDVTPTLITVAAPATVATVTPIQIDTTPLAGLPTNTSTPQPTVGLVVTLAPVVTPLPPPPAVQFPQTRAFALSTSGGIAGTGFNLLDNLTLFARNPVDPNLYVTTDTSGNLYLTGLNGSGAWRPDISPFSVFPALTRAENTAFVSAVTWSPDGRYLAFIVNSDQNLPNDGVWYFQPGQFPPLQLLVDCVTPGANGCTIVSNPYGPDRWESFALRWSPLSDGLLVSVRLPDENRDGLLTLPVTLDANIRSTRPRVYRYDYGVWSRSGDRILVSGKAEDGHVLVGWINRDGSFSELVYDAEANGLWLGFANQASDGRIFALGAPGDRNGPREALRLYNMAGQPLTAPIGTGFPERVEWSPDGFAVFVQTGGQQFIATLNGEIHDITGQVAGARAINWVEGNLPPTEPPASSAESGGLPGGVVEGSAYQPGQQLRVYAIELNIRAAPGTASDPVRAPLLTGEYVAILRGPVNAEGMVWWEVQTADGVVGWIAGEINGASMLGP